MTEVLESDSRLESLLETARRIAATDARVWIEGEPGTGKTSLARYIHRRSARADGAIVEVATANLPENLAESLLFGHERGAFTGAVDAREGHIRRAHEGTLLLDGIELLATGIQAKLLRALQEGAVHPLGAPEPIAVDVRSIAVAGEPAAALLRDGRLRADLYYRLAGVSLKLPALREHPESILPLARRLLEGLPGDPASRPSAFDPDVERAFVDHAWPGNVAELERTVEAAAILAEGPIVGLGDLPDAFSVTRSESRAHAIERGWTLAELERRYTLEVLDRCGGNKSEAARRLGIHRKTLHEKLRQWETGD